MKTDGYARSFAICAICLTAMTTVAVAQWSPVVAKIRETSETTANGRTVETKTRDGIYLRLSNGSALTHWIAVNGVRGPGEGSLLDNKALLTYSLNYKTKQARQSRFALSESLHQDMYANITSQGESKVAGLSCKRIPVEVQVLQSPPQKSGEACVSADLGLMLRNETRVKMSDGSTVHNLTEMYDVQVNVQPSQREFEVEKTFEVIRPGETVVPSEHGN